MTSLFRSSEAKIAPSAKATNYRSSCSFTCSPSSSAPLCESLKLRKLRRRNSVFKHHIGLTFVLGNRRSEWVGSRSLPDSNLCRWGTSCPRSLGMRSGLGTVVSVNGECDGGSRTVVLVWKVPSFEFDMDNSTRCFQNLDEEEHSNSRIFFLRTMAYPPKPSSPRSRQAIAGKEGALLPVEGTQRI
ncbi:Cytokinin riboside 5'-monophosphate phosphoribohydrolase [Psidium guajava]|nr:Cytokinin riboside 5'-monophosphate phosphoribohydrolase [Psidium guajava]